MQVVFVAVLVSFLQHLIFLREQGILYSDPTERAISVVLHPACPSSVDIIKYSCRDLWLFDLLLLSHGFDFAVN